MGDCACHADDLAHHCTAGQPAFAFLELTSACNNRCPGCSNVFDRRTPSPFSGEEWIRVVQHLLPHVSWLKLTGGEPTLHPDFETIVSRLDQWGVRFRLLTNGRWQSRERILALLRDNPTLESLLVSLHGPDAGSHEAFSGVPGSFLEALNSIRDSAALGLQVATSTVITRQNWDHVDEMVMLAGVIGADHAVFNRYIGRPLPAVEATSAQLEHAIQRVQALIAAGAPVRWGTPLPACVTSRPTNGCLAGEVFLTIDPWGNVRPCNHAPYPVGNILEQSFEEIWHSPRLEAWRAMSPAECAGCLLYEHCHGGCRAEAMLRSTASYPLPRKPVGAVVPRKTVTPYVPAAT